MFNIEFAQSESDPESEESLSLSDSAYALD